MQTYHLPRPVRLFDALSSINSILNNSARLNHQIGGVIDEGLISRRYQRQAWIRRGYFQLMRFNESARKTLMLEYRQDMRALWALV